MVRKVSPDRKHHGIVTKTQIPMTGATGMASRRRGVKIKIEIKIKLIPNSGEIKNKC
jgi:hypothetical protein